jgi:predicted SprT family Zn-dependent metalloprotease
MGLTDLIDESTEPGQSNQEPDIDTKHHRKRAYNPHHKEEDLWEMFEELQEKFPEEIKCDFIEVSGKMKNYNAKAYDDYGTQYLRFAKWFVESSSDERIKETMLHEMVHLYTYQKGYAGEVSDGSHIFKWLCGAVGAKINQVHMSERKWKDMAEPFRKEDEE